MAQKNFGKLILFLVWIGAIAAAYLFLQSKNIALSEYPEYVRMGVSEAGVLGPLVFIALYTLRTLTFFSATVFTIAGGLLFGPILGTVYVIAAVNLSSILGFFVGRYFGKDVIARAGDQVKFFPKGDAFREKGFMTVMLMRLLFFPFDWVAYLAGAYNLRFRDVFLGTLIGTLPGLIAFVFLGGAFHDPLKSLPLFAAFFVLGLIIAKFLKKTDHGKELERIKKEGEM